MRRMPLPSVMTDPAQRRRTALLTTAVLACTPLVAVAAPRHDSTPARITTAAAAGVVYGGVTDDGFGLMVEANKSRRQIVRMATGLTLQCASGDTFSTSDGWARLSVKKGKFSGTFGPSTQRNDDGTTVDIEGVVSGKFNRAKTSISGTWSLKGIEHDATGAVTDTCDSGTIHWTAKQ
jgi:hypothetical protein